MLSLNYFAKSEPAPTGALTRQIPGYPLDLVTGDGISARASPFEGKLRKVEFDDLVSSSRFRVHVEVDGSASFTVFDLVEKEDTRPWISLCEIVKLVPGNSGNAKLFGKGATGFTVSIDHAVNDRCFFVENSDVGGIFRQMTFP